MSELLKQFIILSLSTSLLTFSTAITKPLTAIAQLTNQSNVTKRSQSQIVDEILKNRQEVKRLEKSCKNSQILVALKGFRNFQTRMDTGITYYQFLDKLADLKISFNELKEINNLDNNCYSLRFAIEKSLVNYETLVIFLKMKISRNLNLLSVDHEIAQSMFKIYPELPITKLSNVNYVQIQDLISYLRIISYL